MGTIDEAGHRRSRWRFARLNLLLFCVLALTSACSGYSGLASSLAEVPQAANPGDVVGLRLENMGGSSASGRVVTFGQVFAAGDVPAGQGLVALIDGQAVPLQVDVKATNPDGSIRHAILSVSVPALAGGESVDVMLAKGPAAAGPAVDLGSALDGYDLSVTVDGRTVSVGDLVADALSAGTAESWLRGPLATEIRVEAPLSADGHLHGQFDVRALADGTVRTDVIFAYDDAYSMGMDDTTYDVAIREGGQTVAQYDDLEQHHHTTWHQEVWSGGAAPALNVVRDVPYLMASGAVPGYDTSIPVSGAAIASDLDRLAGADTGPMGSALVHTRMPDAGGRDDIGPMPAWAARYLLSQDAGAEAVMLANADAAGSIPWHFRDEATGEYVSIIDHPKLWIDYRGTGGQYGDDQLPEAYTASGTGWLPDTAHQPALLYLPYLMTGDHYYLDELQAQTSFTVATYIPPDWRDFGEGILDSGEVRAKAWSLRALSDAAYITPDDNPLKGYFTQLLDNNLQHYVDKYVDGGAMNGAGEVEGWMPGSYGNKGMIAPWQTDFFTVVMSTIAQRGDERAEAMVDWLGNWVAGRFTHGEDGFDPLQGAAYNLSTFNAATGERYSSWAEVFQATFPDGAGGTNLHADYPFSYAAIAKGTLASLISATGSPEAIEAYGFVASEATRFWDQYDENPKWNIAPRLADGSFLLQSDIHLGSGTLTGGARNELLHGDDGADTISGGGGIDLLYGGAGNDTIAGGTGGDYLFGNAGNDRLAGGAGDDTLKGNAGADLFVYDAAGSGADTILDFQPGTDRLAIAGGLASAASLLAGATQDADGNAVLHLGPDASITLLGVHPGELSGASIAMT